MRNRWTQAMAAVLPLLAVSGCVGGSTPVAMTPTPTPSPTPTPTPTPSPAVAVLAAVQTASPASPVAGSIKFSTLTQPTDFPLLMTAALGGPGDGDAATTNGGGVLTAEPGGTYHLTINNAALGITAVPIPGSSPLGQTLFSVLGSVDSADLDYTRYGHWLRTDGIDGTFNVSAWTTGFVTPVSQIPTQGTATYAGKATGVYNAAVNSAPFSDFDSTIAGDVNLTADFGQSSLSGAITGIIASSGSLSGPVNDIAFSAAIDRNNNLFSGTTSVTSQPGGTYAFGPTASGLINGRFYGPNAAEVGAVFNVSEGARRLIGSFGAKR